MDTDLLDPVATTSRITAAMRATESARPDRLSNDPLADTLAGDVGRMLAARIDAGDTIPVRTRFEDDGLRAAVDAGVRQVVLVAAGMDTRAWRIPLPGDCAVFEVDRPALLDAITARSAAASHLLTDLVGAGLLASPLARPMLDAMAAAGSPWVFGTDDPESLLAPRGWTGDVRLLSDVATDLGRASSSEALGDGDADERGYLVHATRAVVR